MRHAVKIAARQDLGDPIDMVAHHMAAELVADLQRPLEVDAPPCPPSAEGCHRKRLGADVESERRTFAPRLDANQCEARARIGDRSAERNGFRVVGARDPEPAQLARCRDINDLPNVADNPGEHPSPQPRVEPRGYPSSRAGAPFPTKPSVRPGTSPNEVFLRKSLIN